MIEVSEILVVVQGVTNDEMIWDLKSHIVIFFQ
uniref:Uncharacterized protein n=1 Tax=Anguilla anguilla TaxID=7936 RepID=A0A0E9SUW9_ANGAN